VRGQGPGSDSHPPNDQQQRAGRARLSGPCCFGAAGGALRLPVVAYDALTQGFLVACQGLTQGTDWDIYARRVTGEGAPAALYFAVSSAGESQEYPELAQNTRNGEFLAVWQDFRNDSYYIYGQRWIALPRSRLRRLLGAPGLGP
jgi:hypothetical protein